MDLSSRKIKTYLGASIGGAVAFLALSTQSVAAADLLSLWDIAVEQDSKYLSAQHKYLANREGIKQTRARLLPTLSYQYEKKSTDQTINQSDNAVFSAGSDRYPTTTGGFSLTQSVFDYARWERYAQSKISVSKAEVEYDLARQQLLLRLAESYFLVLERGDQLDTVQSEKEAMSKHLALSEGKFKSGLGNRVDVEDARARYLNALSKEYELQSRLADSHYALREVLGMIPANLSPLRSDIKLHSPIPDQPEAWVDMAALHNLELQAMNLTLAEAEKEVSALRAGHYPTVDLTYNANNTETEGSVFGGGSDVDTSEIAVQLNIPLYSGGLTSSKVRQANEKRFSVREDRNDKRRAIERATRDAFYRVHMAIVQIGALEQSVDAQLRLLKARSSGYRSGSNSILEVLDVQQDLSQAEQSLTKARYDYVLNTLRLKFTAGDLQESDLGLVNSWLVGGGEQAGPSPEHTASAESETPMPEIIVVEPEPEPESEPEGIAPEPVVFEDLAPETVDATE